MEVKQYQQQLKQWANFELREAIQGQEALKVWQAWEPHLIGMDM